MRCKIVELVYVAQYYEVNQKSKKFWFYIIGPVWGSYLKTSVFKNSDFKISVLESRFENHI